MSIKKIESREYKVMLDTKFFNILPVGLAYFKNELALIAKSVGNVKLKKEFQLHQTNDIRFLDTKDFQLAKLNYILRVKNPIPNDFKTEYTLKYRVGDRLLAAVQELISAVEYKGKTKFEEDIGADKTYSFISKFSHSISLKSKKIELPKQFKDAVSIFPSMKHLKSDLKSIKGNTSLLIVNNYNPCEYVYTGVELNFPHGIQATVALILWYKQQSNILECAELSLRYALEQEKYLPTTVKYAYDFFQQIQQKNWCHLGHLGKTSFAYTKARG